MLAPVVHFLPETTLRRERLLPVPGRVLVHQEQKVASTDVVAEASFGQEHQLIDAARLLGVRPEAAQGIIQVKAGSLVSPGDVLARRKGMPQRLVRATRDGRVTLVGDGQIFMEVGDNSFALQAGLPGTISRVIPDRGVEITFTGALVQGVWGNGQLNLGLVMPMLASPEEALVAEKMDVSMRGAVLLAGCCNDPAALQAAADLPARGVILGSLSPALIPQALQMPYPIIVIDGIGQTPLNHAAYQLLMENARREATLNAAPLNLHSGVRPEIFFPQPATVEPSTPEDVEAFAPEQTVRLRRAPHDGATGTLINLRFRPVIMPSGLRLPAAEVRLESGEQVLVPLVNLEIVK